MQKKCYTSPMDFPSSISHFPITPYLEKICQTLKNSECRSLVLTAETGAGKSTVLPLALLQEFSSDNKKIIMTEPRRLAVVGVANRVSELSGEETGGQTGYRIHLENKISSRTRLEVMTEGILIRMLQSDPSLEGVNLVVLDEFHERSVNTDLALAFLREAMELRDDLFLIIMSATIESKKIADFLGNGRAAPVMEIPGRTFPVQIYYKPDFSMDDAVISYIEKIQGSSSGRENLPYSILCFLPGISEIRARQASLSQALKDKDWKVEICLLHSSVSFSEQKHILTPPREGQIRVILSSAIAETSLTIPGISCVIDSGLSRIKRVNFSTGMENLVTEAESEFSASQRSGRAGREREGVCIRLWNKLDVRQKEVQPEILRSDLSQLVLECHERGIQDLSKIRLLDSPSENAWKSAEKLLLDLGCLDQKVRITERGKAALQSGISVRLACIGIDGMTDSGLSKKAAFYLIKYGQYDKSPENIKMQFLRNFEEKISKICQNSKEFEEIYSNLGLFNKKNYQNSSILLLSGFPDRLAMRLAESHKNADGSRSPVYQFPSGRKAILHCSKQSQSRWLVAADVMAGQVQAIIFDFEELDEDEVKDWLSSRTEEKITCRFEKGKIIKNQEICYGELVLSSKKLVSTKEDYAAAWMTEIRLKGLESLPLDDRCKNFLERVKFFNQQNPEMPELSEKIRELSQTPENWLLPFITTNSLSAESIMDALNYHFSAFGIEEKVPMQINLQNGNRAKIKYEKLAAPDDKTKLVIRPVIEIIIQRAFGCSITPKIVGMKVLFRLLSPAQRPLQITDDLENFWTRSWPEICKEMKGRYPKHKWDASCPQKD